MLGCYYIAIIYSCLDVTLEINSVTKLWVEAKTEVYAIIYRLYSLRSSQAYFEQQKWGEKLGCYDVMLQCQKTCLPQLCRQNESAFKVLYIRNLVKIIQDLSHVDGVTIIHMRWCILGTPLFKILDSPLGTQSSSWPTSIKLWRRFKICSLATACVAYWHLIVQALSITCIWSP